MSTAPIKILAINYGGHDTSAALMIDGQLVAACEQERYDLTKHSRAFPTQAIDDCLQIAATDLSSISEIAFTIDVNRSIREAYLRPALESDARIGFLINDIERIRNLYSVKELIRKETGYQGPINHYRHHLCHLASSYFPSGFGDALLISHDGIGEIECSMIGIGREGEIQIIDDRNRYPHSLGLLYSAMTFFLGWRHHCDEGIIMGLAPYGDPNAPVPGNDRSYYEIFTEILKETGPLSYEIDQEWMAYYEVRDKWVSDRFTSVFGQKRNEGEPVEDHHRNIAAALQLRLEDVVLNQLKYCRNEFGLSKIGIAGGVGLNCSLNGQILSSGLFDEVFVQPASGDSGVVLGACYLAHRSRVFDYLPHKMHDFYCGYRSDSKEISRAVEKSNCKVTIPDDLYAAVAERLNNGKIIAWYQGPAEFGPRALGNRSILCRPFPSEMRDFINAKVKFREFFRPFAPAVLQEHAHEFFQINQESPHMLLAVKVRPEKKDKIPAVVHVDDSCRVQTVGVGNNKKFRRLLEAFYARSGIPVLLNTSFNVKGKPIVNTAKEAVECFESTNIDCLAIGDHLLEKTSK